MYYFDHSATTPLLPEVSELMDHINKDVYGNPSSIYSIGRESRSIIENARKQIARSISARPEQIFFTSGGTEANNHVFWSLINNSQSHIVSNVIEHPAVTKVLEFLNPLGLEHELVSVNEDGIVSVDDINKAIKPETSLISLMLANNEIGTLQPVEEIVEIAKERDILVHTDAVQCMGKIEIDVSTLRVDFLSLSAHKFYGPKGVGVLYVREPKKLSPLIIGGGQEKNLRAGTENISAIAGMGLAAETSVNSLDKKVVALIEFEEQFKSGLNKVFKKAIFNGNQSKKLPGLINVSFPGNRSDIIMTKLDRASIAVSNGSACGSGDIKPSPILSAIGLDDSMNLSTIRFSFGASNTPQQIDYLLTELKSILI